RLSRSCTDAMQPHDNSVCFCVCYANVLRSALDQAMQDRDFPVRRAAAQALDLMKDRRAIPALTSALSVRPVTRNALLALQHIGGSEAQTEVEQAARSSNLILRQQAQEALQKWK